MLKKFKLPEEIQSVLDNAPSVLYPTSRDELIELALGGAGSKSFVTSYDIPGKGIVDEVVSEKRSNGVAVNYFFHSNPWYVESGASSSNRVN